MPDDKIYLFNAELDTELISEYYALRKVCRDFIVPDVSLNTFMAMVVGHLFCIAKTSLDTTNPTKQYLQDYITDKICVDFFRISYTANTNSGVLLRLFTKRFVGHVIDYYSGTTFEI